MALLPGWVSRGTPGDNGAHLREYSIRSGVAQTYGQVDLSLVDDGSVDDTQLVLARFTDHPGVRIITQSNQQLPKALSNGFAQARGEFWTWTSADNLMSRNHVERLVAKLRAEPWLGMTYADFWVIDERAPTEGLELVHVTDEDEYFPPPRELRDLIPADDRTISAAEVLATLVHSSS